MSKVVSEITPSRVTEAPTYDLEDPKIQGPLKMSIEWALSCDWRVMAPELADVLNLG